MSFRSHPTLKNRTSAGSLTCPCPYTASRDPFPFPFFVIVTSLVNDSNEVSPEWPDSHLLYVLCDELCKSPNIFTAHLLSLSVCDHECFHTCPFPIPWFIKCGLHISNRIRIRIRHRLTLEVPTGLPLGRFFLLGLSSSLIL